MSLTRSSSTLAAVPQTSRGVDRLEGKVQQINNCSLRLHLIPASARSARGVSHEISLHKTKVCSRGRPAARTHTPPQALARACRPADRTRAADFSPARFLGSIAPRTA